jgi:hypothetical protein
MLQLFVFPQIDGIEREEEKGRILFQHDSVTPHFSQNLGSALRCETAPWSPQIPDLSPLYLS